MFIKIYIVVKYKKLLSFYLFFKHIKWYSNIYLKRLINSLIEKSKFYLMKRLNSSLRYMVNVQKLFIQSFWNELILLFKN